MANTNWDRLRDTERGRYGSQASPRSDAGRPVLDDKRVWRGRPPMNPLRGAERADAIADFMRTRQR